MYLAYIDEAGNTGRRLDDPDQPVHWLVAILVPEDNSLAFMQTLDAVVADHVPEDPRRELHGADIFSGTGGWRGVAPATRLAVYERALGALDAHDCSIAHASIDKHELSRWQIAAAPHLIGLHFLMEKIDTFVAQQDDPLRQRALLIADETHEHEAFAIDLRSTKGGSRCLRWQEDHADRRHRSFRTLRNEPVRAGCGSGRLRAMPARQRTLELHATRGPSAGIHVPRKCDPAGANVSQTLASIDMKQPTREGGLRRTRAPRCPKVTVGPYTKYAPPDRQKPAVDETHENCS